MSGNNKGDRAMKKTIFKYSLQTVVTQDVLMISGAKILCVQAQNEIPCLWVEVELGDEESDLEARRILIYGTGHTMTDDLTRYIGSYQLLNGELIFHVYEKGV
jgi:hypothetical protein